MSRVTAGEVCRLVVEGPTSRIDLSVPVGVPLCDLLPSMVHHLGDDLADLGLEHGGWVLQRLGEEPLDEDRTTSELDLRDGDRLYLRPRSSLVPPLDYDDLVDGIAEGARERSTTWTPRHTALAGHVGVVLSSALAVAVLLREVAVLPAALGLVGLTVLLIGLAALTTYRFRAERTAAVYATCGVLVAATVPLAAPGLLAGAGPLQLLGWGTGVLVGAVLAVRRPDLVAALVAAGAFAALLLLLAGALLTLAGWSGPTVAVSVVAVVLLARVGFPALAFRLAGLELPPLPRDADDVQDDIDPAPGDEVVRAAARTECFLTALVVVAGLALASSLVVVARVPGPWGPWLALAVVVNLALSTRPLTNVWQRISWFVPGVVVLVALGQRLTSPGVSDPAHVWLLLAGLIAAVVGLPLVARSVVRRPVDPRLGRIGDVVQTFALVLAGPLSVLALEVHDLVRRTVS